MDADEDMLVLIVGDDTDEKRLEVEEEYESDGQANNDEEMESLLQGEADYFDDDDAEFVPQKQKRSKKTWKTKTVADIRETRKKKSKPVRTRARTLKPSEWKSYVQDLLKKRPELIRNEQLLVETLANLMKKTKAPAPPEGFYRIDENTAEYVCETCDAVDTTIKGITRHYQTQHGELYLVCYACGSNFRYERILYNHEMKCKAPDAITVLKARGIAVGARGDNRPFMVQKPTIEDIRRKRNERRNRLRQEKAKSLYHCSYCSSSFLGLRALDAHENLHRGERPYVCDYCMANYGSYNAFNSHRKTHEQKQYICDHCGNSYKHTSSLKEHLKKHNPASKLACEQCDRKFYERRTLKLHMRKFHDNLPPAFPCQICPKRYSIIRSLKNHMRKEHGMELITRNMFIRSFPKLTEVELDEAKVINKEDVKAFPYVLQTKKSPIEREPKM